MRRPSGGYTLIEVLLFVAISSVLLSVTYVVVRGQAASTEFRSSMNDVNTKFQQWMNQVDNGFTSTTASADISDLVCEVDTTDPNSRPQLTIVGGGGNLRGANPECIFLGKAIQVNDTPDFRNFIYAYTVIGRRTYSAAGEERLVNNIVNAKPVAALLFPSDTSIPISEELLTEEYRIPNGVRVLSSKSSNVATADSHLGGFFIGFNSQVSEGAGGANSNGSTSVMAMQYPLNINTPPKSGQLQDCIQLISLCVAAPSSNPWPLSTWNICFASTRSDDIASLTITSASGTGVLTNITYGKLSEQATLCD